MTEQGWRGLVGGLLEFLSEEAEEPEHAADAPRGFRGKAYDDVSEAKGHAGGVLFVAPDGDVLLCRRSPEEKNYGGHWALPGGKVEEGETVQDGIMREVGEEMGEVPEGGPLRLLDQKMTPTGMAFHTLARSVPEKFQPHLNGEHVGYAWFPLDRLPEDIHPGVAATLRDRIGATDFDVLRPALDRWLAGDEPTLTKAEAGYVDEAPGPKTCAGCSMFRPPLCTLVKASAEDPILAGGVCDHWNAKGASDAFLAYDYLPLEIALDFASDQPVGGREVDQDGRLRVARVHISKANVSPYKGSEIPQWEEMGLDPDRIYRLYRHPDELKKGAETSNGVQLLRKHIPVNAEDAQQWDVVGSIGTEAQFSAPYLDNSLTVWTAPDIEAIQSGKKKQLSMGYFYRADMTPGKTPNGEEFDGVMRDIRVNHVAVVSEGRAGPDVVVADSAEEIHWAAIEREILNLSPK